MLIVTLVIVAILFVGFALMSTEQVNHINRAAVAMFTGVIVWVVYMLRAGSYINLVHYDEYMRYLGGVASTTDTVKDFVANHILNGYISEACSVILFLIATNTILEVMNNNGVFDSLVRWLRMRNSRRFLWLLSALTFIISFNVDNLTTVVLMLALLRLIVRSYYQKVIYACVIMISASLGGCFTVIGDMTSLMLWVRGAVTPTDFTLGLAPAVLTSLCVFNILASTLLKGKVEVVSFLDKYDGDDSTLKAWQKVVMLIIGIVGLWSIPSFSYYTKLPPFLGALCVLALIWVFEGICNIKRNLIAMFVQRNYFRNTEFIGMRIILYFIGISLGVGALNECGALDYVAEIMEEYVGNIYIYGIATGLVSSVIDNVPIIMTGMNLFSVDTIQGSTSNFVQNGVYWQMLSYCCAMGGSLLFIGTLAGQAVLQVEGLKFSWYIRHYTWRVVVAWAAGLLVFWMTH